MVDVRAWSVPLVSKPTPAKMKPCGFVRSTPAGFLAGVLVSSVETLSGVSAFVTLAQHAWKISNHICFFIISRYNSMDLTTRHIRIRSTMAVVQEVSELKSGYKKNARWSQKLRKTMIDLLNRSNVL